MILELNGLRFIELGVGKWYLVGLTGLVRLVRRPFALEYAWSRKKALEDLETVLMSSVEKKGIE